MKSFLLISSLWAAALFGVPEPMIYFQPNTTQLFTELYQAYGLQDPPARTFFENALYLDQSIPPTQVPLQPSNQIVFDHTSRVLGAFHEKVKDLELYVDPAQNKPFFFTAAGSKHLIVALVYGIVMSEPHKKFVFVEEAPFYSGHPSAVTGIFNYPNARFLAFHDPAEIKLEPDEVLVEFVTSPNNPDGKFRKPLTDAKIILADFVFASSAFGSDGTGYLEKNIEWIKQARQAGKHVFSFNSASKQFGKTGTRCGYIWYPMQDAYAASIFSKFFSFISASTVAGGSTGLEEFLDLIKAITDLPDTGIALRKDANLSLIKRHELIAKEILNRYPGTSVISIPGSPTFFAKISDPRIPEKQAWEVIRDDYGAVSNAGAPMGESNAFIRLNLSGYSQGLVAFLNRLTKESKYTIQDVLITDKKVCDHVCVCAKGDPTVYHVSPKDCFIDANAEKGAIIVSFTPWMGYDASRIITVTKTDASLHPVEITSAEVNHTLQKQNDSIQLQWKEPLYQNGQWHKL